MLRSSYQNSYSYLVLVLVPGTKYEYEQKNEAQKMDEIGGFIASKPSKNQKSLKIDALGSKKS